ncbi:DUF1289 domain-containing protein [Vibrio sp.]|nr:DUF1289 domain-containing protein [Vibrio sp.]
MEQLDFFEVINPCVGICQNDSKGYCMGCMRKRNERFDWNQYTNAQKLYVIKLCRQRYIRSKQGSYKEVYQGKSKVKHESTKEEASGQLPQQASLF